MIRAPAALAAETDSGTSWPLIIGILLVIAVVVVTVVQSGLSRRRRPADQGSPPQPTAQPTAQPTSPQARERAARPVAAAAQATPTASPKATPKTVPQAAPESAPEPSPPPARVGTSSGIFISYRRQDEPNFAGRLYDRLADRFGRDAVFMDVDTIDLGVDFAEVIDQSLAKCRVMIVVIGAGWLGVRDEDGDRRLDNPDDFVRLEIERALDSATRVIPVLVEGAAIPKSTQLPPSLAPLSRRNGIAMAHASFTSDASRLIATLDRILAEPG